MDPNEALRIIREEISAARQGFPFDPDRSMEHFEVLDEWLSKEGFPPNDWRQRRPR